MLGPDAADAADEGFSPKTENRARIGISQQGPFPFFGEIWA